MSCHYLQALGCDVCCASQHKALFRQKAMVQCHMCRGSSGTAQTAVSCTIEVVASSFTLWLEHKILWRMECSSDCELCFWLRCIFKAPHPREAASDCSHGSWIIYKAFQSPCM
jgi:hypothetical protein